MKNLSPLVHNEITSFDDVIKELNSIIEWSVQNNSRIGLFAAIYKNMTVRIKNAADAGAFQDKARIEKLDVTFAKRYFAAIDNYHSNLDVIPAWTFALQKSKLKFTIVLQQLLLSMNPHINMDLAIATSSICTSEQIVFFYTDFLKINAIMASAMIEIEKDIFSVSPVLSLASKSGMKVENKFFNFSLNVARCESWSFACQLIAADEKEKEVLIQQVNDTVICLGKKIIAPGLLGTIAIFIIGIFEFKSIKKIIMALDNNTSK
jgi:hypothetical protein